MPKVKWTYDVCLEEALKYTNYTEFRKKSNNCYSRVQANNWEESICAHLFKDRVAPNYWTLERCKEESLKYNTLKEFSEKYLPYYRITLVNDWKDAVFKDFVKIIKPKYWTKDRCIEEVKKYSSKRELFLNNQTVYGDLYENGWMKEAEKFFKHRPNVEKDDDTIKLY